jgi:hypothetical protein
MLKIKDCHENINLLFPHENLSVFDSCMLDVPADFS